MLHKIAKSIDVNVYGHASEVTAEGCFLRVRFGAATARYKGMDGKDRVIGFGNRTLLVPNFNIQVQDSVSITMEWKSGYPSLANDVDLEALLRGEAPAPEIYRVTEVAVDNTSGREVHQASLDIAA